MNKPIDAIQLLAKIYPKRHVARDWCPVHEAVKKEMPEILRILVTMYKSPNARNYDTFLTPMDIAVKKDKHELFHTLKKVLYEDDTRRRSKEAPHPPQPTMYMQSTVRPHGSVYMKPNPQLLITSQPAQPPPVKRPRSPSPTRSGIPAAYYR